MPEVALVEKAMTSDELARVREIQATFPVYVPAGRSIPPGFSVERRARPQYERILEFAPGLAGRADTGRYRRRLTKYMLANRGVRLTLSPVPYFRGTYADQGEPLVQGVDRILDTRRFVALAHDVFDVDTVVPITVFANLYLPGQGLLAHTDVPAFRGAERGQVPAWMLVAMHHSGLFERWRLPVATVVVYPESGRGGDFYYYPRSPSEGVTTKITVPPIANSAVALDADTIFHGVEQVASDSTATSRVVKNTYLVPGTARRWKLYQRGSPAAPVATFRAEEVRYSISWKAYCFADADSYRTWLEHSDDLPLHDIVPILAEVSGASAADDELSEEEMAARFIDELIPFPFPVTE